MLAEGLKKLEEMAVSAAAPQDIETDDPRTHRVVVGGEVREFPVHRPRCHRVDRVESLLLAGKSYADGTGSYWHTHGGAVLIVNDTGDQPDLDQVQLDLVETCAFSNLRQLSQGEGRRFGHAEFLQLLRVELHDVFPLDFLAQLRQLKVHAAGSKGSDVAPGRERGTSEFTRELAQADQVPDSVLATVPVYDCQDLSSTVELRCALDLDLDRLQFILRPIPDQITLAIDIAQQRLHEALEPGGLAVFYGSPG